MIKTEKGELCFTVIAVESKQYKEYENAFYIRVRY